MSSEETINQNAEDMLFLDIGDIVEAEDPGMGATFPVIQWDNGDPAQKRAGGIGYTGGWFISAEQGIQPPGFEPYSFVTSEGQEIQGFSARNVTGTIIRYRRSWLSQPSEKGLARRFPWGGFEAAKKSAYDGKPRGRAQILFAIDGMDEPVVLTLSGMAAAAMLSQGKDRGVIPNFKQVVANQATMIARKAGKKITFPLCAFRVTIGPKMLEDGSPFFRKVGQGDKTTMVAQPTWIGAVTSVDQQAITSTYFIGRERFEKVTQQIWKESAEWAEAWSAATLIQNLKRSLSNARDLQALESIKEDVDESGVPGDKEVPF